MPCCGLNSTRYGIPHTVTVLDTIYRTLSQYSIRYNAHCHSTRYDIPHTGVSFV